MFIDYGSVLAATGAAAAALCVTFFTNWLRQRSSGFLMTWACGMAVVVSAVVFFGLYEATLQRSFGAVACFFLTAAFAIAWGGQVQFRDGDLPLRPMVVLLLVTSIPGSAIFALGYEGIAYVVINSIAAVLLCYMGWRFWQFRQESPAALTTIAGLHHMLGISFLLCAIAVAWEGQWQQEGMPQNWAEVLNLICSIIAITGIGGLFTTIYQERIARAYKVNSLTDALTGLANRRALYDEFEARDLPVDTGVAIFDLDDFKGVNDQYGHGFGDLVLIRFARLLEEETLPGDIAARLGGEEFCVISKETGDGAFALAERIRARFMTIAHSRGERHITCTVSAGVAIVEKDGCSLDTILRKADNALYLSKRNGRNQVSRSRRAA